MYALITVVNFGIGGASYISYMFTLENAPISKQTILKWEEVGIYYNAFVFFWNIVPFTVIMCNLFYHETKTLIGVIKKVGQTDRYFLLCFVAHIVNILVFYIIGKIANDTDLAGGDRALIALQGIYTVCNATHVALNCIMIGRIKVFMKKAFSNQYGGTSAGQLPDADKKKSQVLLPPNAKSGTVLGT